MDFPVDAVKVLIEIVKSAIVSGDVPAYLKEHWREAADAVIDLVKWFLADSKVPEPVGAVPEQAELGAELLRLKAEYDGVAMAAEFSPTVWISLIMWLLKLLAEAKQ